MCRIVFLSGLSTKNYKPIYLNDDIWNAKNSMCGNNSKGSAVASIYIDNDRTRVTEWRFLRKGDNTGWHTHEYDYVVVPLFDGLLEIDNPDGSRSTVELKNGVPYYRDLGVQHDVINGNDFECAFVEIEILKN